MAGPWEQRREVWADDNYYDRYQHDTAGAAVAYDGDRGEDREFLVVINGAHHYLPYPDCTPDYGDRGNPIDLRLRWDAGYGWTVYVYMFAGDGNPRVEYQASLPG